MDLSKLPRLSKTEAPTGPADGPTPLAQSTPTGAGGGQPVRRGSFCDQCGAALRVGARFCDGCGTPVAAPAPTGAGAATAAPVAVSPRTHDRYDDEYSARGGPEAWISVAIGLLLLLFAPNAMKWASSKVLHTSFTPYVDPITNKPVDYVLMMDGSKVAYRDQITFWSDWAITTFALALIVEGAALLFSRRPLVVLLAFLITAAATLVNLVYFLGTYSKYGLAPLSAIAVIFGVFMAAYQWRLLMALVAAQRQSRA